MFSDTEKYYMRKVNKMGVEDGIRGLTTGQDAGMPRERRISQNTKKYYILHNDQIFDIDDEYSTLDNAVGGATASGLDPASIKIVEVTNIYRPEMKWSRT